jgi:hypothetical protein
MGRLISNNPVHPSTDMSWQINQSCCEATRKGRVPALDATTGPVSSHIVVCNTLPLLSAKRPREPHRTVRYQCCEATRKGRVPALDATTGPVSSHIVVCNKSILQTYSHAFMDIDTPFAEPLQLAPSYISC